MNPRKKDQQLAALLAASIIIACVLFYWTVEVLAVLESPAMTSGL